MADADPNGWTKQTDETPISKELSEIDSGTLPANFSPPSQVRRVSAIHLGVVAALFAITRGIFWHGAATGQIPAIALGVLALYVAFMLVQVVSGLAINELYQSFWVISGMRKFLYIAMIVCTIGVLCLLCTLLLPGIGDKL